MIGTPALSLTSLKMKVSNVSTRSAVVAQIQPSVCNDPGLYLGLAIKYMNPATAPQLPCYTHIDPIKTPIKASLPPVITTIQRQPYRPIVPPTPPPPHLSYPLLYAALCGTTTQPQLTAYNIQRPRQQPDNPLVAAIDIDHHRPHQQGI